MDLHKVSLIRLVEELSKRLSGGMILVGYETLAAMALYPTKPFWFFSGAEYTKMTLAGFIDTAVKNNFMRKFAANDPESNHINFTSWEEFRSKKKAKESIAKKCEKIKKVLQEK